VKIPLVFSFSLLEDEQHFKFGRVDRCHFYLDFSVFLLCILCVFIHFVYHLVVLYEDMEICALK